MSANDILSELRDSYINGFPGQVSDIEQYILALEKGADFNENFQALYRRVHSIKGSAGTFGFSIISSICHQMEDYLTDHLNENTQQNPTVCNNLFTFLDLLSETGEAILAKKVDYVEFEKKLEAISKKLSKNDKKCICVGISEKVYRQIIKEIAQQYKVQCTFVDNGLTAIERLLHEHFDILITAREIADLNGIALIGALRLNKRKNVTIQSILITSNPVLNIPTQLQPNYVINKDKEFSNNLLNTLEKISSN